MARITKTNTVATSRIESGQGRALPIIVVLSSLLLVALSVAGYFYYQYRQSPKIQSAEEVEDVKEAIGTIFELPMDEEPTLATVTDRDKLAEQPFFQKAENGDKVLIYSVSGRAVLYRPSVKKVIDVTSVNVTTPAEAVPAETAPVAPTEAATVPAIIRVALYNGSTKVGITNSVEAALRPALPNAMVVTKDKAAKTDYMKTVVVDVTGANSSATLSVASAVGGEVGSLPEGEKTPADVDVLVIIGNDK